MACRGVLSLGSGFLFQVIETLILAWAASVSSRGQFPRLGNVGAFKNVTVEPAWAECGLPGPSSFCQSSAAGAGLESCTQRVCIQDCPHRSSTPPYTALLSVGLRGCIPADHLDLHPHSSTDSTSFIFGKRRNCSFTFPSPRLAAAFTLAVWLKPEQEGVMCVIEKTAEGQIVFKLTISEKETMFYYRTVNGLQPPIKVMTLGRILVRKWIHLSVQVHETKINFFLNGLEEDDTAFDAITLSGFIVDFASSTLQIGQSLNGLEQFVGRMQDFRLYEETLTNREIQEVFSGDLPHLHSQSQCRCPGSHPRVPPRAQRYCIPNGVEDKTNTRVLRLHPEAHPLSYVNDDDVGTSWVSHVFTDVTQLNRGVTISMDLGNGQYQVFYIIIQFFSPQPTAIRIQRKKEDSSDWEDWQYFARNCSVFGMENNGDLENPDSVNCLQLPNYTAYSHGNVTVSLLTPGLKPRPGYHDFYNIPSLQEFVKATQIRLHFHGQYYATEMAAGLGHRYYSVGEVIITGRCQCHGHADSCDTTSRPYQCLCSRESATEGLHCDRCLPLYNDKPFRQGNQAHAFHCKPCRCHGHSRSCHYNASVDPFPSEHRRGGGGVCDSCQHHTTGRNCELCEDYFFRRFGVDPSAIDVCTPCDCDGAGTRDGSLLCNQECDIGKCLRQTGALGKCVRENPDCQSLVCPICLIGGQCNCKRHVSGRRCSRCQPGFYSLRELDPDGCRPCDCNTSGTVDGDVACHPNSGQCKCKANVIGRKCDHCNFGFKLLQSFNNDGCESCQCNPHGSVNKICDPFSGQCECKKEATGLRCDACRENFYGLDASGCTACECHPAGSLPGSVCDARTGQCRCKPDVGGRRCDACSEGHFRLQQKSSFLCLPCRCSAAGTINGSLLCDNSTGQCPCKLGITGRQCNQCEPHRYNLTMGDFQGCQMCDCDSSGTLPGSLCDPISGQCQCLPHRQGRRCDQCQPGFYLSPGNASGCLPCSCHASGAVDRVCSNHTGQCTCHNSTTGQTCDRCKEWYFGFDPQTGRCQPCNCHLSGALNKTCHLITGQCFCKQFVTGSKCETCVPDASHLDTHNPLGCSKTPSQQPPPRGQVQSSSAINLSWSPPDSPNAHWLTYSLFRDGSEIYTSEDQYPYNVQYFRDTSLSPYTSYSYHLETASVHGATQSAAVIYTTKPGVPSGHLNLSYVLPISSDSVTLTWTRVSNRSGPIEKYILSCSPSDSMLPWVAYEGHETSATIWNLVPFTKYRFSVQACTSGGCVHSSPITLTTAQAPPRKLGPPEIQKFSSTELHVEWSPPVEPNGIILRYELYMRRLGSTEETRVFESNGWPSPHPSVEPATGEAPSAPQAAATIRGLEPYTEYQFRVSAENMAGSVSSAWTLERTGESAPVFMTPPAISPLSSHSLNVSWAEPPGNVTRGKVLRYNLSMISEQRPQQSAPLEFSQPLHCVESRNLSYIMDGLKPYTMYTFAVSLCNSVGCVTSASGAGRTLAAAPAHLKPPVAEGINSTTMHLRWLPPEEVNGPAPVYQLERREPSLSAPTAAMMRGTRFPGSGYYKFPSSTHPFGADFTGIKARFRTRLPDGLIVFAASPSNQEEYFALQLKSGRPYFLFDPQGSPVEVTTTNDHGKQYSDGQWHEIVAVRHQASGHITVDGQYVGSSAAPNGSTIIGNTSGLFVGGLPQGYPILRKDLEIIEKGFVGCLQDVQLMKSYNPSPVWEPLDWTSSEEQSNAHSSWEGCPASLGEGAQFLGAGFLELRSDVFRGGMDFEISLKFRTDQSNGLLLFVYNEVGPDFLAVELKSGALSIRSSAGQTFQQVELLRPGGAYCDGNWKEARLTKEGPVLAVGLEGQVERSSPRPGGQPLEVSSPVYLGGVPQELYHAYRHLGLQPGFGGCVRDVRFTRGAVVALASVSSVAVRVNLDGCLSSDSTTNCRGDDSILVYRGREWSMSEAGLQPFTEYLYRVRASHEGGSVYSDWSRARTPGTAPPRVPSPSRALSISGSSVEVTWDEPVGVRGVITKYMLKAYEHNPSAPRTLSAHAVFVDTSVLTGVLTGLLPFRNYAVTLTACTPAGCTESAQALNVSTPQEAPQKVQPPVAESLPNALLLSWDPPRQANGVITRYSLYMDGMLIYSGAEDNYTVTDLGVFTPHRFLLCACTHVGCTNSSWVMFHTAQLPPEHVESPLLTVLDPRTIHVRWKQPGRTNGILERYVLYVSNGTCDFKNWTVVYNSTELSQEHVLWNLFPGNKYLIKLGACTGGGCALSEASEAMTDEDIPEGVPAPQAHASSTDSFNISWTEPEYPNGVITSYGLYLDGILIHNSSELSCRASGLAPGSVHSFRVQACTDKGCGLGPLVEKRTLEAAPEGTVNVVVTAEGPRDVHVRWDPPLHPNGRLIYTVLATGTFYADQGNNYTLVSGTKIIRNNDDTSLWVLVNRLVPFTNYTVRVNASNSRGSLVSDPVMIAMPPAAPDGVLPPRLSSATPTTLRVVWSTPARNNAPGAPRYQLQMRPAGSTHGIAELLSNPSASLSHDVRDLQPYTEYEFRLVASNGFGSALSSWIALMTAEDKPGPIKQPVIQDVRSRRMSITWLRPTKCNGVITHYNIYLDGQLYATTSGNVTNCTVTRLHPHTAYRFQVEACTSQGCSLSPESSTVWTLPGPPEGIPSPELFSSTPTSVIVSWQLPTHPNGMVENFTIERRLKGKEEVLPLVTLLGGHPRRFMDSSPALSPWTKYEYRILMSTRNGGTNSSAWAEVTTKPSRPAGVQPPEVDVLGPHTAQVTWKPPLMPHGDILSYEIRMPDPRATITNGTPTTFSHRIPHLTPFTNYSVTIVACSGGQGYLGGCTESLPTSVTTPPAPPQDISPLSAIPLSESYVGISWQPPSKPNGPNLRYELLRRKIQQPLASNPPEDLNRWHNIYSGTQWFYEDKGLSRFTTYEYQLFVHNSVGFTPSQEVTVTTLAGLPERGANLTARILSHTAIEVTWAAPTFQDLQGDVEYYTLFWSCDVSNESLRIPADVNSHVISHLSPNTEYWISISVFNGVHSINSTVVRATTFEGKPQGLLPPEVVIVNRTAARVIWTSPSNPNGAVTGYSVYVNSELYKTGMDAPGSLFLRGLSPFTIYDIQVEVCTKYACTRSNGTRVTTAEDTPGDIPTPQIHAITSRSLHIDWLPPGRPNGIILGYDLLRKVWHPCPEARKLVENRSDQLCQAVPCQKPGHICGHVCYSPGAKVCCSGILYDPQPGYRCCEQKYIPFLLNSTGVCCGGRIQDARPNHQCCAGYYVKILPGEVCCPDAQHDRVSVGLGNACCGRTPYLTSGPQICCAGRLQDSRDRQCCGGHLVSKDRQCCGGEVQGAAYRHLPGMFCCGQDYVNVSDTICCSASSGESKSHVKKDDLVPVECCETELIPRSQKCCNGVGYNPLKYVCSDKISTGMVTKETQMCATLCPASMEATAHCGRCDFSATSHVCVVSRRPLNSTGRQLTEEICASAEETVYTGSVNTLSFTDVSLKPYMMYEYRISAWNSYGRGFSEAVRASTKEDAPEGVTPPQWAKVDDKEDAVVLHWKKPIQSNGPIVHYILLRNGIERFRGTSLSFLDTEGIEPFQEYSYQLKACTEAGCTASRKVVAAMTQGVPENVSPPRITAPSARSLHLSWSVPEKPNGVVKEYRLWQGGKGLIYSDTSDGRQHTITGLQPYTNYSFTLVACTSAGCASSEPFLGQTPQAAPQGVWATPRHTVINSTAVELHWSPPERPNGLISQYRLSRNGTVVFLGSSEEQSFTDAHLAPNSRYIYELEAQTGGGSSTSDGYIVQTPVWTPEEVHPPHNVTVIGPDSIFIAWTAPGILIPHIPVEYNVLLNDGSVMPLTLSADHHQSILLEKLVPFTQYEIRIQACQNGGCGVSRRVSVRTSEAGPEDLSAPVLKARGSSSIEVQWAPPRKPNGAITSYFIHRRPAGVDDSSVVFVWREGALEFIDNAKSLRPFMLYEYRVSAQNSQGSVDSPWSSAQTLEAPPQALPAPWARATGAHSVFLNWTEPKFPNGLVSKYRVVYQERSEDPASDSCPVVLAFTMPGSSHQANLFGLEPFTAYRIGVVAANGAGEVASPWTLVQTLESSPSGLGNFSVEQKENGRALLLQWAEPTRTNGIIKTYDIFSEGLLEYTGLSRQFLFRRLEPFSAYSLTLQACTAAGCAHSPPQAVWTEEAPPDSQMAPTAQAVEPTRVQLRWSEPMNPNGKIVRYEVIRRCSEGNSAANRTRWAQEEIIFTEYNTEKNVLVYNDTGLQPWTQCGYKICSWNSVGHSCSAWGVVRTSQAPPEGLAPPEVTCVSRHPLQLLISWRPPEQPNGVVQSYGLRRNGTLRPFSSDVVTLSYADDDVHPFSTYSYALVACTPGGCSTSQPTSVTTPEAAPLGVAPPTLRALSATQIDASWSPPSVQNGKITEYLLRYDGQEQLAGQGLGLLVSRLRPDTLYNFSLVACTRGGCAESQPNSARTMEAPPEYLESPTLQVMGSESIEITWKPPRNPNGQIRSYELRRDGTIVYTGLETRYHDFALTPGVEYAYTVMATNSQGGVLSPLVKDRTSPSAPSGVGPPKLRAELPQELLVAWDPPARTNGDITNYTLFILELFEREMRTIHIDTTHSSFGTQSFAVKQLRPFHRYEVRIQACTTLGCASSDWASIQTPEMAPLMQPPPHLEVGTAPGGFQPTVTLEWTGPLQPNGKVLYYELYRRQTAILPGQSDPVLAYNGSSRSFVDSGLLPFTEYEYQVRAVNSAGKAPSNWTRCRTGPAPPEGLQAPTFHAVSSTQAVVNISIPERPNGNIGLYRLFSNTSGTSAVLSEGTVTQQTLHGLKPFTSYSIGVEACTCFNCCSRGPTAELRTRPAPPSGVTSPQVQALTSRTASFQWRPPLFPNGVIQSYELQLSASCPPESALPCPPGQTETKYKGPGPRASLAGLQPHTRYRLRLVVHNEAGSVTSQWTGFITQKELPQYRAPFLVTSNASLVRIDWSKTFLLNGRLQEFVVTDQGQRLYSGRDTSLHVPSAAHKTFLFQVTCTTDVGSVKTPLVQYDTSTGFGVVLTTPGDQRGRGSKSRAFYSELWFVVLMATLALILLAIFVSLILQRKIQKEPYIRERPPLVPLQKRAPQLSPHAESQMCDSVADISDVSSSVTLKSYTMHFEGLADTRIPRLGTPVSIQRSRSVSILRVPSPSQLSRTYSQGSLHRSISQLMDIQDKKVLLDDSLWETIVGHSSGLYVDEEDLMNAIKGFSSVTKEHTTFTDTHL